MLPLDILVLADDIQEYMVLVCMVELVYMVGKVGMVEIVELVEVVDMVGMVDTAGIVELVEVVVEYMVLEFLVVVFVLHDTLVLVVDIQGRMVQVYTAELVDMADKVDTVDIV